MKILSSFPVKLFVRFFVVVAICLTAQAQAGVVSTQTMMSNHLNMNASESLVGNVDKSSVRDKLIGLGVAPEVADTRLAAMTQTEINYLNKHIDELPAGEGVLGLAVFVFVVFIITDAVCVTDIYSFVNCAK